MAMYTAFFLLTILMVHLIPLSKTQCLSDIDEEESYTTARDLGDSSTIFSFNLLRALEAQDQLRPESAGIFFCPHSVWLTLMVTYLGARGQTEAELKTVLGVGSSNKRAVLSAVNNSLNWNRYKYTPSPKRSFQTAISVFFQNGIPINKCIYEMTERAMSFIDFQGDPLQATNIINKWVEFETKNRIQNLLPPGSINHLTKMIIANAIYFEEIWQTRFDLSQTSRSRFTLMNNTDIDVNMMHAKDIFMYAISEELQCTGLVLPYSNDLTMLILLPNDRHQGVSTLANRLTLRKLNNFNEQMHFTKVEVSFPKFKLEDNFELSNVLDEMGIRTLFDPSQADLSGFTGSKEFSVAAAYHKTFINVNEEGRGAALTMLGSSNASTPVFTADHPFIFMIRDLIKRILFVGTVKKPLAFGQF